MKKRSGEGKNPDRKNGKARKQNPKKPRKTGRTIGGYKPAKLAERASKRDGSNQRTDS
jgi:hypothetical protein